jgi:hypothetical protein
MGGVSCWDYRNGERQTEGLQEEEAALLPDAGLFPKIRVSDRYTGRYRWTGPEQLWLAVPEDPPPKK